MKTRFLLFILAFTVYSFVNAQTSGPTKEQTIEFIKAYFDGKNIIGLPAIQHGQNEHFFNRAYYNYKISFDNDILSLAYTDSLIWNVDNKPSFTGATYYKITVNLKDIESVTCFDQPLTAQHQDQRRPNSLISLQFRNKPGTKSSINSRTYMVDDKRWTEEKKQNDYYFNIPIQIYDCNNCNPGEENKKIVQAFNHLRKLCGAPEPISFD